MATEEGEEQFSANVGLNHFCLPPNTPALVQGQWFHPETHHRDGDGSITTREPSPGSKHHVFCS